MRFFYALAFLVIGCPALAADLEQVEIDAAKGPVRFTVELADDPQSRAIGLMFRPSMPPDHGMLFDYHREQLVTMWMKNTLIPLDMLFIAGDGRIVHIAMRTVPRSLAVISSGRPVRAVLELNAGTAEAKGIRTGDFVRHGIFGK